MNEWIVFSLFTLGIFLWFISQPTPTKIYEIRFKRMLQGDIERMTRTTIAGDCKAD